MRRPTAPRRRTAVGGLVALIVAAGLLAGCSLPADGEGGGATDGGDRVTVLAAASLADVMPELVEQAQRRHPRLSYEVSYAGSSQIVRQLNAGAEADAVVLAGEGPLRTLDRDVDRGEVTIVATNSLVLALAPGNPGEIERFTDVARKDVTVVVCAEQVPCGEATAQVFEAAGVSPQVASYEPDVRATLSKVASGEADAAMVYVTDVVADDLPTVPVPERAAALNRYPAFSLGGSQTGASFVSELTSPPARDTLRAAGFGLP